MRSLYGACLRQTLGEDQRVPARAFRDEARPEYLEPQFLEPGHVGGPIGIAPVHWRAMPVVVGTGPGSGSKGREEQAAGPEPAMDFLEDRRLFLEGHVDDCEEG